MMNKTAEGKFEEFFRRLGYGVLSAALKGDFADVVVASLGTEALDILGTDAGYDLLLKTLGGDLLESLGRTGYKEGSVDLSVKRGLIFGDLKVSFKGITK